MRRKLGLTALFFLFFCLWPYGVSGQTFPSFKTWKVIKLGTYKSTSVLRQAVIDASCNIGTRAENVLSGTTVSQTEIEIELVNITVEELGFVSGATREQIYKRALEVGLELCPGEVGPQLRIQYKDQPDGEWLGIAMKPVTDLDGHLNIFGVGHHSGGLWLDGSGDDGTPIGFQGSVDHFLFARRK